MTPKKYDFKDQYRGTWFKGIKLFITKKIDGVTTPLDITGFIFEMDFKRSDTSNPTWSITNGQGITIVDAVNGHLNIDGFINNYPAYTYKQDLKITPPNDESWVHFKGIYFIDQNTTN